MTFATVDHGTAKAAAAAPPPPPPSAPARSPYTVLLLAVWFSLCSLLVSYNKSLAPVFYAFVASFAATAVCTTVAARLAADTTQRAALSNAAVCLLHSVVILGLLNVGDAVAPRHLLAVAAGYSLCDVWKKTTEGLFVRAQPACDLAHHILLPIWYISALYKGSSVPLQLFAAPVAAAAALSSASAVRALITAAPLYPGALELLFTLGLRFAGYGLLARRVVAGDVAVDTLAATFAVLLNVLNAVTAAVLCAQYVWRRCYPEAAAVVMIATAAEAQPAVKSVAPPTAAAVTVVADSADAVPPHLWKVHGALYDLSSFVAAHPGGQAAIGLGQGRDCTALFESYHPFTNAHRVVLARHRCAEQPPCATNSSTSSISSSTSSSSSSSSSTSSSSSSSGVPTRAQADPFYADLCTRVQAVLEQAGLDPRGVGTPGADGGAPRAGGIKASPWRVTYYAAVAAAVGAAYWPFVRGHWPGPVLFAVAAWLLGAAGHDGGHFAVSRRSPAANAAAAGGIALIASPFMWAQQHTYAHHSHTNDFELDPDLHHFGWLRTHARTPWGTAFALQSRRCYVYSWYALVVFGEALWLPLKLLMSGDIHGVTAVPGGGTATARVMQIAHFLLYACACVLMPLRCGGGVLAVVAFLATSGLLFGWFSQINHLNARSVPGGSGESHVSL
jgi:Fatty acid desaturase/Cytochrome b5-like Heme/Steroid binding domain